MGSTKKITLRTICPGLYEADLPNGETLHISDNGETGINRLWLIEEMGDAYFDTLTQIRQWLNAC